MRALLFRASIPRYIALKPLIPLFPRLAYGSPLSLIRLAEVPEPRLPSDRWVKIKTSYAGVCGSDMGLVMLNDSPSSSVYASFPFVPGHENVGRVVEAGGAATSVSVGDRVIADPLLPCRVRGIEVECEQCRSGEYARCESFAEGTLSPGMLLGTCADVGGSFAPYYLAHESQVMKLPDTVSDETACVLDAFQSSLHPVMRHFPKDSDTVVVYGCGVIGLCVIHALKALGSRARIVAVAKHDFQADAARSLGADKTIGLSNAATLRSAAASLLGAKTHKPILGPPVLVGGADMLYLCVGTGRGINDGLQLVRAGGKVVLIGLAAFPKSVDWAPIWQNELSIHGCLSCSSEEYEGERMSTYRVALRLATEGRLDLEPLLTHTFDLSDYRRAFRTFLTKPETGAIKVAFAFDR